MSRELKWVVAPLPWWVWKRKMDPAPLCCALITLLISHSSESTTARGCMRKKEARVYASVGWSGTSKNNSNEVRSGHDGGNSVNEMSILRKMDVDFPTPHLKIFTLTELRSATSNFRPDAIIGGGGFGTVFKGWLDEKTLAPAKPGCGMVTAVEKLNAESMQGIQELQSEIDFLGRLSHPNLVKFLGYCLDEKELLLVYEFMAEGSLEQHLFKKVSQPLSWSTRLKILIGAARGLAFLHTSDKQVIYRDFKTSNIMLDSNYHAKLSDFGLAKKGRSPRPIHPNFVPCRLATGRVRGTYGYPAQQDLATGSLYRKGAKKLSDFGLAKKGPPPKPIHPKPKTKLKPKPVPTCSPTMDMLPQGGRVVGTYGYPAPKDVATGDLYGNSDDVYGFGGVLLEMLTGLRAERNPSLSFLLDKLLDPGFARVFKSYGYAAPEDVATGELYGNSDDVQELGEVLQEMLFSGLRSLDDSRPSGLQNLVESTRPLLSDRLERVMDKRLKGQYPPEAALKAAQLSLKCLDNNPRSRPSMKEVVDALEQIEAI